MVQCTKQSRTLIEIFTIVMSINKDNVHDREGIRGEQ